jgi:hypothetical protein
LIGAFGLPFDRDFDHFLREAGGHSLSKCRYFDR